VSTTAAILKAEFRSTGAAKLVSDFKSLDSLALGLSHRLDVLAGQGAVLWRTVGHGASGFKSDLTAIRREFEQIDRTSGRALTGLVTDTTKLSRGFSSAGTALRTFTTGLHTQTTTAEADVDRLQRKLSGLKLPNLGGGGGFNLGGGLNPLSLVTGPLGLAGNVAGAGLGLVGNVAGAGLGLAGGALGMAGGAVGAAGGFAVSQGMQGVGDVAALDRGRQAIAAHMGDKFAGLPKAQRDAILGQITDNAFLLSSAPETGKVNSDEALAAMDEAAKAGITDPTAMMNMAKTALQLRAAGGENKISTDNAMRLLITGKNAFGGKYSDTQVANSINGLVNGTTLDIGQIQSILKNGGAANISGMSLDQYLLQAGMMAQAGVAPGQIGGGIKQMLQMSQPRTGTSKAAMAQLGLISTETHTEGGTAAQDAYWSVETDPWGQQHKKYHAATKGTKGKQVTTMTDNGLWDPSGNIVDPGVFFEKLLKGTQGMTNEQSSKLVSDAFNPKAAGYIEQVLGYYRDNPQAFTDLRQQMKLQSDVAATAATQNDNLETSLSNLGDTVQNLKNKALLPILDPLKGFVNGLTTLGQDALKGDWSAFSIDVGKVKADLLGQFQAIGTWISTEGPKLLGSAKFQVLDVVRTLFGDDPANRLRVWFDKDLPDAWNGAVGAVKGLVNFWDTTIKPILLGTDAERTQAITALTTVVGTGIDGFLNKDLPALLDRNKDPLIKVGEDLAGALVTGFWNGFKKSDIGAGMDALTRGDMGAFLGMLNKHGVVGWGGADSKEPNTLPAWLGGGQIAGTGPQDTSKPPPGKTAADGHYDRGVWVNNLGGPTPPPPVRAGQRPDNVGAGPSAVSAATSQYSSAYGGARAGGGRVSAGTLYQVNELGVELFRPDRSGTIVPAGHSGGGGGGQTFHITVQVQGGADPRQTGHLVAVRLREELGRWDKLRSPQS